MISNNIKALMIHFIVIIIGLCLSWRIGDMKMGNAIILAFSFSTIGIYFICGATLMKSTVKYGLLSVVSVYIFLLFNAGMAVIDFEAQFDPVVANPVNWYVYSFVGATSIRILIVTTQCLYFALAIIPSLSMYGGILYKRHYITKKINTDFFQKSVQ